MTTATANYNYFWIILLSFWQKHQLTFDFLFSELFSHSGLDGEHLLHLFPLLLDFFENLLRIGRTLTRSHQLVDQGVGAALNYKEQLQNMFFLFKETNLNSLYFFDLFEFWLSDVNWNQCLCQKGDIISDSSKGFELTSFRSKFFIVCLCIRQSS